MTTTTFEQAYAAGAVGLIAWLKASPNGGHNRLAPEEILLVAELMNTKLNDTEVKAVWGALCRDPVVIKAINPLVMNRIIQAATSNIPPRSAEEI